MARPIAASAAARAITRKVKMCPSTLPIWRAKVRKLRFTALSMSSIDMKMMKRLRRETTPTTPMQKSRALTIRKSWVPTMGSVSLNPALGQDHHADHGDGEQERDDFE